MDDIHTYSHGERNEIETGWPSTFFQLKYYFARVFLRIMMMMATYNYDDEKKKERLFLTFEQFYLLLIR